MSLQLVQRAQILGAHRSGRDIRIARAKQPLIDLERDRDRATVVFGESLEPLCEILAHERIVAPDVPREADRRCATLSNQTEELGARSHGRGKLRADLQHDKTLFC